MINPFFKNNGPFKIKKLLELSEVNNDEIFKNCKIFDIKDLHASTKDNITFFHSRKYEDQASLTKASFCITTKKLSHILPIKCKKIIVNNVLITTAKITKVFYPESINDDFDAKVKEINKTKLKKKIKFGKNVLIGSGVKIGKNCFIGHNTIIESNVVIGNDCSIGSNVILRNSIIKDNVKLDVALL